MDELMSLICFVLLVFITVNVGGEMKVFVRDIADPSQPLPVNLTCSLGEWIHIQSAEYRQCGQRDGSCNISTQNIGDLSTLCVGKQSCYTSLSLPRNSTITRVNVYYECIGVNRFSFCDESVTGAVYTTPMQLHSYSFPVSMAVGQRCRCTIIGLNMTATIYDLDFLNGGGAFSVTANGSTVNPLRMIDLFNNVLFQGVNSLQIMFYDAGENDQNVWLNVAGSARMVVSCSRDEIEATTSIPRSTITPATTQILTSPTTKTTPPLPVTDIVTTPVPITTTTLQSSATTNAPRTTIGTMSLPPAPLSQSTALLMTTSTSMSNSNHVFSSLSVKIGIICGAVVFLIFMIVLTIFITLKCVKRREKFNTMQQVITSRAPLPAPRQSLSGSPEYQRVRSSYLQVAITPEYLQLTNTNNTYSKLDIDRPGSLDATGQQEYTELHVYESFSESRPKSRQFQH